MECTDIGAVYHPSQEIAFDNAQDNADVLHHDTGEESNDADNQSDSTSRTIHTDGSLPAGTGVELD